MLSVSRSMLAAVTAGLSVLAAAPGSAAVDEAVIRQYAPELHLCTYGTDGSGAGKDWTRPANIDWYLNPGVSTKDGPVGAAMRFNQSSKVVDLICASDDGIASPASLNRGNLASTQWKDRYKKGAFCAKKDPYYYANQKNSSDDLTLAYFFLQPRVGSGDGKDYDKVHHGIYGGPNGANPTLFKTDGAGESVADLAKDGIDPEAAPPVGRWVMYTYVLTPSRFGGAADIQYWFFYAYDDAISGFNHESDWERVTVTVNATNQVTSLYLTEHENGTQFVPDTTGGPCNGGFISRYTMKLNGQSQHVCLALNNTDGQHPVVYSADGSHAVYPSGCGSTGGTCTWNGYAGGTSDTTTSAGPAWQGWLTSGSAKNYEIVTDGTNWLQYANLWGEIGTSSVTSGKYSPKWQEWGLYNDTHPNGNR
jgi:hypothetical protein